MNSFLVVLHLFLASVVAAHPTHSPSFSWDATTALLAFGDSYTYVQGTEGRQNYSFIGDAFKYSFTPKQLLSDEIVQNQIGTSAGGPNWVEYLTRCFEGLPSRCTDRGQKELWDFAFAGADVSDKFLTLHHNYSVDLDSQVQQWNEYARNRLPIDPEKSLVAVWIGINDVSDSAKFANVSFPSFYTTIIKSVFKSMETFKSAGYQNFLFMNLPPLEKTPPNVLAASQNKTVSPNATQVMEWNQILTSTAAIFANETGVANAFVFDTYGFLNGVIENPGQYGIQNVTGYCARYDAPDIATNYAAYGCLPIAQYFWYNTGHITFHVHEILAYAVRGFLEAKR